MMENSLNESAATKVSLNMPKEFKETWYQFQYIISKDPKIPKVEHQKQEMKKASLNTAFRREIYSPAKQGKGKTDHIMVYMQSVYDKARDNGKMPEKVKNNSPGR